MKTKMLRVHPGFKDMLQETLDRINSELEEKLTMIDLTRIMAIGNNNGSNNRVMTCSIPIILLPVKKSRGRPSKPGWHGKYVNIVLEDKPR